MRKRSKEERPRMDDSEVCRGSKQRRKMKSSERFARDLQSCESTLDDAKRIFAQLKSRIEHNSHIRKLCYETEKSDLPILPIPSSVSFPNSHEENILSLPMSPMPVCMVSLPSFEHKPTSEHQSDFMKGKIEHNEESVEDIVSPCVDGNDEVRSLYSEPPSEECGNIEAVKGSDSPSFDIQQEHFSGLSCQQAVAAETSNMFVMFLEKLTRFGIIIDYTTTPGSVKKFFPGHQVGETQQNAAEESKEVEPEKQFEKGSLLFSRSQEVPEESKEVQSGRQFETSPLLFRSQEVAEELKEIEPEKHLETSSSLISRNQEVAEEAKPKQFETNSLLFSRTDEVASESDSEDDGGYKHLWEDMEFSLACMNESKRSQAEPGSNKNDGCNHEFYKKDDVGLVCSLCGLVGQDTEYIFNFIWGEGSYKKRSGNQVVVAKPSAAPAAEELSDGLDAPSVQQTNQPLVLHPEYRDKLHAHQEDGLKFLQRNLIQDDPGGCILAHAPGTGKTFLTIAFLQSFQTILPNERPVIVAPKGMLSVWMREFYKWKVEKDIALFNLYEALSSEEQVDNNSHALGQLRYRQLQMLRQWRAQKSVLLVGYSTFSKLITDNDATVFPEIKKTLLEVPGLLILDEGHFPRNKETRILKSLSQVRTKRRVLLSGTLFQNNFDELYNLYHLVRPDFMTLNMSCTKALLENMMKANSSPAKGRLTPSKCTKQRSGKEAMELRMFEDLGETIKWGEKEEKKRAIGQLRQLSEPFVHWYKGQVLGDLPGLIDLTLILKLTDKQEVLLSSLQDTVDNQLDRSIKSRKVCIHPSLFKTDSDSTHNCDPSCEEDPLDSPKIMFVLDLLQLSVPSNEKVLLFSQLLDPFYLLEKLLKKVWGWHLNQEILKIEGRTSLEERETTIDRFNHDPKTRILFASIKTCGEGVSLIGASRIVLLDVSWNPMVARQAISRAFRIGQKKKVFVYRLVGGGAAEEDAHSKACEKEWLAKQIFESSTNEDYSAYCHEVSPQEVDTYFESQYLRENVLRCYRCHFV